MVPNPKGKRGSRRPTNQPAEVETPRADTKAARAGGPDISPKLERKWFEFDRSAVLRQIDVVQTAIDKNAKELAMVAVEGVFEKPLADELLSVSRALNTIAQELGALHGQVGRIKRYPKAKKKRS